MVGKNTGEYIELYKGIVYGTISEHSITGKDVFGFDGNFIPRGSNRTLYQLDVDREKDLFSARKLAVDMLLAGEIHQKVAVKDIQPWGGEYQ